MARRKRRAAFAPRFEAAEPRTLLSGIQGINLGSDYFTDDDRWVNVLNMFPAWNAANAGTPVNSEGYPVGNATNASPFQGTPDGVYNLQFQGTGDVYVGGMGLIIGQVVKGSDGVSRAQVQVTHANGSSLYLSISNVSASDPIRDMKLTQPGYDPNTTQVFTNDFLQRIQPFTTLRLMGMLDTNADPTANWSDRSLPTDFSQLASGLSWEDAAALADESGKDIWVNVPTNATDDYVTQLASLLHSEVNPGLHVYVEYSNETWNTATAVENWVYQASLTDPLLSALPSNTDSTTRVADQSAVRIGQIAAIFRQQFGAQAGQVRPVFSNFNVIPSYAEDGLAIINQDFGAPGSVLYGLAASDYFGTSPGNALPNTSLDNIFANLNASIAGNQGYLQSAASAANEYGLPLLGYEGGLGVSTTNANDPTFALLTQADADPRMGDAIRSMSAQWASVGGGTFNYNVSTAPDEPWGFWGLLTSAQEVGSPKWDAVMGLDLPAGDATLDGTVNYADFQILQANFGQAGIFWWQQGDFNHDNTVNEADLELLRSNLGTVTPAQAVQVALFNAPTTAAGSALTVDAGGRAGALTYSWTVTDNGAAVAGGNTAAFTFVPAAGTNVVTLTVTAAGGATASGTVNVSNGSSLPPNVAVGGTATASGAYDPSQTATAAFDGNPASSWLVGADSGWLQYQLPAAATVTQYQITSGSDTAAYPGRAPGSWQLLGSNDGQTWATLDTETNQADTADADTRTYAVASPGAYLYYRLNITANNGGGGLTQLAELALLGTPALPPNVAVGGTATASGAYDPSQTATAAFDGNPASSWLVGADSGWLQYQLPAAATVTQYQITSGSDTAAYPGRAPGSWQLLGSNDGQTWATLDTETNQADTADADTRTYAVASPGAYLYYRLNITANNGGGGLTQLAELRLLGTRA